MVAGADHQGALAIHAFAGGLEQFDHAVGCARPQHRQALRQAAEVVGVEAVDVLVRADALDHQGAVDVLGQRQLHQDAVDALVGIEPVDLGQQRLLRHLGVEVHRHRADAHGLGAAPLVAHIDFGSRIGADQHGGQGRGALAGGDALGDGGTHAFLYARGDGLAVNDLGGQRSIRLGEAAF